MATITTHTCDICQKPATKMKQATSVVFTTEQTEGRYCTPYLVIMPLDLCGECFERIVCTTPLTAQGGQGHNIYEWRR
jgi:hypothetical protein